jgi:hypothetical protein
MAVVQADSGKDKFARPANPVLNRFGGIIHAICFIRHCNTSLSL